MHKDFWASDVDKGASGNAEYNRTNKYWSWVKADTNRYACGFNEWESKKDEENGQFGLGPVLTKGDS